MYKLCTTEKPSVAKDIAKVIGANKKEDGYYIGNGYIVTWAVGHLVGLAEPDEYNFVSQKEIWSDEKAKEQAFNELPLIPSKFKTVVLENTKKQFKIISDLMARDDIEYIIDCGDMGAEGHILQWLIREKAGNKHQVKRFCATSMTKEAIKEAMNNLRDVKEFEKIIIGEFCKKRADWILGMSLSRCASIKYNAKVDVGRVQSPTLYFVVKRYIDVNNFKEEPFYEIKVDLKENFSAFFKKDIDKICDTKYLDDSFRLNNKDYAEKILEEVKTINSGIISKIEENKKAVDRPQLYDITELQRDGNKIFGYSASEVLDLAQSLYEKHKILSYPRTDSRYITSDLVPYMPKRIEDISKLDKYKDIAEKVLENKLNIDKKIVNDVKVVDHHGLIITEEFKNFDLEKLNEKELNILDLIIMRMLVSFSYKYKYTETVVTVSFGKYNFYSKGKSIIDLGWKAIEKNNEDTKDNEEQFFDNLKQGQSVSLNDILLLEKMTTAPKYHTEATLLTAMEKAGSKLENGEILKGKGIGTQATRASIIKSLFDKRYIENKKIGKTNYLIPTKQGINTIKVLPSDLYSPKITADWESKIFDIVNGDLTEDVFMTDFEKFINQKISEVKNSDIKDIDFTFEKEVICKCYFCGADVYKGKVPTRTGQKVDNLYCSKKCGFSLRKNDSVFFARTKKNMTTTQIEKFAKEGVLITTCTNSNGKKYKGQFNLEKNEKNYSVVKFSFPKK